MLKKLVCAFLLSLANRSFHAWSRMSREDEKVVLELHQHYEQTQVERSIGAERVVVMEPWSRASYGAYAFHAADWGLQYHGNIM